MTTPTLTDEDRSEIRSILEEVAKLEDLRGVHTRLASRAMEVLPRLAQRERSLEVRRSSAREVRGESATARHKRIVREVRERDGGCTARGLLIDGVPVRCFGALEHEHQWGRGRELETVESTRMMCAAHHKLKQDGSPSRAFWIRHFLAHAERYGYEAEIAHCARALAMEEGQHPKHAL